MAKYKALRSVMAYPYDASTPDIEPGTVFDVNERDPAEKKYIEELQETPGAVEKVSGRSSNKETKPKDPKPTGAEAAKPKADETPKAEAKAGAE